MIVWERGQRDLNEPYAILLSTHLVFEVLADCDTVTETFPSPRLEHQISSQTLSTCWLQSPELNRGIRWVSGYCRPVVKAHLTKGLSHCCRSEIRFEAIGIEDRDERFDSVQRGTRFG